MWKSDKYLTSPGCRISLTLPRRLTLQFQLTAIVLFAAKKFYNAKSICDPLSFGNRNLEEDLLTHFATQLYGYLPSAFYEYV